MERASGRRQAHGHKALEDPTQTQSFGSPVLYKAMAKYGLFDTFSVEELRIVPIGTLDEEEAYWITELGTLAPNGYNLTAGGDHGSRSAETREAK